MLITEKAPHRTILLAFVSAAFGVNNPEMIEP